MALYDALLLPWPRLPTRAPGKAARASSRRGPERPPPQPPELLRWAAGFRALLQLRKACAWPWVSRPIVFSLLINTHRSHLPDQ